MYSVHALVVAVCTRGHVALNANDVYVDDIYRYVRFMPRLRLYDLMKTPNSNPMLLDFMKFTR